MGINKTDVLSSTDLERQETEFFVYAKGLDSNEETETSYSPQFNKWNGYYNAIPEAKAIIKTLITWTFGKGFHGEKKELDKLKRITGNGKENALKVFKTTQINAYICGDGFAEIIKDKQGRLINLKCLNSERITTITDRWGRIKRYEQTDGKDKVAEWDPEEILHIIEGKVGDENHGHSIFESIETLILGRNEVIDDLKIMFHRFVKPIKIWTSKTDNLSKLAEIAEKINQAYKKTENLVVPENTLKLESTTAIPTQTGGLSPLDYYEMLIRVFVTSCAVPEVIMGYGKDTTEASSKIVYLAWQQTIEEKQKNFEDDIEIQLNIKIELDFPVDISDNLQTDQRKDGNTAVKKSDLKPSASTKINMKNYK
jgi:hypothetical protein